ncbi:MAG: Rho termination factor N-terminal domain-containing protein [Clostridiales bacterium]|uniref:Rho termination factor N-terminal domain-containing protein n=1 Tax=Zhenhengia yiwuensis TaxID=2763666 RepID=A0A926EJT6_9FIRM|nr:Rho termination factor N-terminal domain-containing protein [Zhenhengia yiwuensis]MBC8581563.1 Rho termination factor N-terminal domain-containing protein [Zhenhengia yiwuensis]MDU6360702.1 Rho termination factor N-terminal domain-containing protein [Clostridiales bacterium]
MHVRCQPIPFNATLEVAVLDDTDGNQENYSLVSVSYETMKITELKALCKEKGIEGYSSMTKSELIKVLEATQ